VQARRAVWVPVLLTAAALAVRASRLGDSLWADEIYTWRVASLGLRDAVLHADQTPPLHAAVLHLWMQAAGDSEAALRFPSAVAGALAAGLAVPVARRWLDEWGAILAGLLVAFHPGLVLMGQEARSYAFFALFGTASWWLWLKLADGAGPRVRAAYVAASALMLYSHVFGVFFLAGQGLAWLWTRPERLPLRRLLLLQIGAFALFAPWLGVLVDRTRAVAGGFWIQPSTLGSLSGTVVLFAGAAMLLVLHVVLWIAAAVVPHRRTPAGMGPVLASWAAAPVAIPYAISFVLPIYTPRYAVPAATAYLLLAAWAVRGLRPKWNVAAAGALLAGSLLLSLQVVPSWNPEAIRTDWRDGAAYVDAHAAAGDKVVFWPGYCDSQGDKELSCAWGYYGHRGDLDLIPVGESNVGIRNGTLDEVGRRLGDADHAWLMEVTLGPSNSAIRAWLSERYPHLQETVFPGLRVAHYTR
jgi:hypothetical protein